MKTTKTLIKRIYTFFIILIAIFVSSCDRAIEAGSDLARVAGVADEYPTVKHGLYEIKGRPLTSYVFQPGDNDPVPLLLATKSGHRILAEGKRFGNHSVVVTPVKILCGEDVSVIDENDISAAYLNSHIQGALPVFQVYKDGLFAGECVL
jgi:hypothetical protein